MTTSNLSKELSKAGRKWATSLTRAAKGYAPNTHIRNSISTKSIVSEGQLEFAVSAKTPDARAYELGSGIHAKRKTRSGNQLPNGKILIRPREKKLLAFEWDIASSNPENFSTLPDGRVVLPQVEHPGVEAANNGRGYLAPAVNDVRKQMRKDIPAAVRTALRLDIKKIFGTNK